MSYPPIKPTDSPVESFEQMKRLYDDMRKVHAEITGTQFQKETGFYDYQLATRDTAVYTNARVGQAYDNNYNYITNPQLYVALGLTSEAGEVADVFKKTMRDNDAKWTEDRKKKLIEELGDVLWYAARIADEFNWNLQTIAELNLKKLQERKANGEIHGR